MDMKRFFWWCYDCLAVAVIDAVYAQGKDGLNYIVIPFRMVCQIQ